MRLNVSKRNRVTESRCKRARGQLPYLRAVLIVKNVARAAGAATVGLEPHEHSAIRKILALEGFAPDEIAFRLESDHAAKARLCRDDIEAQLVAIKGHAGFETERVAAREPARLDVLAANASNGLPRLHTQGVRNVDFEAVLARVTGAGKKDLLALVGSRKNAVVLESIESIEIHLDAFAFSKAAHDFRGFRALNRNERDLLTAIGDLDVETLGAFLESGGVDETISRVRDGEEAILCEAVDDQVIDDAAFLAQQERVLRAPHLKRTDLARKRIVKRFASLWARKEHLAHVREIELAGALAHGGVLGEIRGVAHGHIPARKIGERGALAFVNGEQWAVDELGHRVSCPFLRDTRAVYPASSRGVRVAVT